MHILKHDQKQGMFHIRADSPEDLWHLSRVINTGDHVRGTTERKIKIGGEDARNQKVVRKKMTLTLNTEKASYENDTLRILGTITDGPDDIARGEHHSINVAVGDNISITKHWHIWEITIIKEACTKSTEQILIVLFDREEALFMKLTAQGHQVLTSLNGDVAKKGEEKIATKDLWQAINIQLEEYNTRYQPKTIIAGSPAFWKDYLAAVVSDHIQKKMIYTPISAIKEESLHEILKRPELKTALQDDRNAQEHDIIEQLLAAIAKDKAAYGIKEVEEKAAAGNLQTLSVSDHYLMEAREMGNYETIESIMKNAEQGKAHINIITSKQAMKQLDGLGGIAGITRW